MTIKIFIIFPKALQFSVISEDRQFLQVCHYQISVKIAYMIIQFMKEQIKC